MVDRLADGIAYRLVEIFGNTLSHLGHGIGYCIKTSWEAFAITIKTGKLDDPLILFTIAGIMLWQLGARWQLKYIYWSWVIFWLVRGLCVS